MEGVLDEPPVASEPEATRAASAPLAVSPPPCSMRLAIACSVIALKNCGSGSRDFRKCSSFRFCFESWLEAYLVLLLYLSCDWVSRGFKGHAF
jgi:hypothetical protein